MEELQTHGEYFKLTVTLNGRVGSRCIITGQDEIITYNDETIRTINSFEITENNRSFNLYLKHNQVAIIGIERDGEIVYYQIPVGTLVTIEENDALKYKTSINETDGKVIRNIRLTGNPEDNVFDIENYADFDIAITGVMINIIPYIILIIIVIVLLSVFIYKKIKDNKDDEIN